VINKEHRSDSPLPSLKSTLLAAVAGVCIGLLIVALNPNSVFRGGRNAPGEQTTSGLPQINVLPTLGRRMNILVMGVDSNGKNTQRFTGTRSDTMMMVSIDPESKDVGVVSIPRDSRVKIAGNHGLDKINAAHAYGGPDLAVATVEQAFGVNIDHYVVIDVQGLRKVFDVLGPVDVIVEKPMHYQDHSAGLNVALEPGLQRLDSQHIEEYLRFRHDARADLGRTERQQWFLRQLVLKLKEPQVLMHLPELYKLASDCVVTDLPLDDLARLAYFAKDLKPSNVKTATLPGEAATINGCSYFIDNPAGCAIVLNRLLGTPLNSYQTTDVDSYNSDSAFALPVQHVNNTNVPISCALKYPVGMETAEQNIEAQITRAGYVVKSKFYGTLADCQHEQIIQNSARADNYTTRKLQGKIPELSSWPIVVNFDSKASTDFTLVISPTSRIVETSRIETPNGANRKAL
jgi:LCP family protein required for cell wall assembly